MRARSPYTQTKYIEKILRESEFLLQENMLYFRNSHKDDVYIRETNTKVDKETTSQQNDEFFNDPEIQNRLKIRGKTIEITNPYYERNQEKNIKETLEGTIKKVPGVTFEHEQSPSGNFQGKNINNNDNFTNNQGNNMNMNDYQDNYEKQYNNVVLESKEINRFPQRSNNFEKEMRKNPGSPTFVADNTKNYDENNTHRNNNRNFERRITKQEKPFEYPLSINSQMNNSEEREIFVEDANEIPHEKLKKSKTGRIYEENEGNAVNIQEIKEFFEPKLNKLDREVHLMGQKIEHHIHYDHRVIKPTSWCC